MTPLSSEQLQDKARGCLIGLAIGDAVGTTLEFQPRGSFTPIDDMVGGGPFSLKKGYWTDDTSMALCLGHSLVESDGFDAHDQMMRYCEWMDNGYMSSIGICFDVGSTVATALRRFQKTGEPFSGAKNRWSSGNGCLMRMAPVAIFYQEDSQKAEFYGGESSLTTHASELCHDASRYFAKLLMHLINGADKQIYQQLSYTPRTAEINAIKAGEFVSKSRDEIKGSGYVIDSLEAALWCFTHSESYPECVLLAANLGDDADTTAAIAGQLAGAFYGYQHIRPDWRQALHQHDEILKLADALFHASRQHSLGV
ncbi:ADP-ribosylglycohydrolase [Shewanella mangrovi]|uniref:ADP-ribosylglycohydrolase n=1 Tax=Shewanella mangrovi TaxID=1515746 RepID=A0A094LVD1_9GAMM|nr:ADP-ribosylglycohydrolase family protein [Shewanella mangrovi]KFZ39188.1 ADP-ribosylglycohydrolase [Shewanella mangrovi]